MAEPILQSNAILLCTRDDELVIPRAIAWRIAREHADTHRCNVTLRDPRTDIVLAQIRPRRFPRVAERRDVHVYGA